MAYHGDGKLLDVQKAYGIIADLVSYEVYQSIIGDLSDRTLLSKRMDFKSFQQFAKNMENNLNVMVYFDDSLYSLLKRVRNRELFEWEKRDEAIRNMRKSAKRLKMWKYRYRLNKESKSISKTNDQFGKKP